MFYSVQIQQTNKIETRHFFYMQYNTTFIR